LGDSGTELLLIVVISNLGNSAVVEPLFSHIREKEKNKIRRKKPRSKMGHWCDTSE
jgi:hypothetical protein